MSAQAELNKLVYDLRHGHLVESEGAALGQAELDAEVGIVPDALRALEVIQDHLDGLPQVFVSVLGGVAEAWVTRGKADIVFIDWDEFEDNVPTDEWITETRAELERLDEKHRAGQLAAFDEEVQKIRNWNEEARLAEEDRHAREVLAARKLIEQEEARVDGS